MEFTVEGYNERAFISMNQQQVQQLEIDDGNTIQVVDIDRNKPFAIVLPINAGNITFYDVNRNTVEYWNNSQKTTKKKVDDFMPDGIDKGVEVLNLHGGNPIHINLNVR